MLPRRPRSIWSDTLVEVLLDNFLDLVLHARHRQAELLLLLLLLILILVFDYVLVCKSLLLVQNMLICVFHLLHAFISQSFLASVFLYQDRFLLLFYLFYHLLWVILYFNWFLWFKWETRHSEVTALHEAKFVMSIFLGVIDTYLSLSQSLIMLHNELPRSLYHLTNAIKQSLRYLMIVLKTQRTP